VIIDPELHRDITDFMGRAIERFKQHSDYGFLDELDDKNLVARLKESETITSKEKP
jgi:hypothetical protein